jgi:hypothetical protein
MKQLAKSTNADNAKRAEQFTFQVSGHYLRSERNTLACFASAKLSTSIYTTGSTLAGFHTTLLQPPRFA